MGADFWMVVQWWGTLFLVGAAAWPLTKALFGRSMTGSRPVMWWDEGYFFSKAVGMAVATWIVYVLGTLRVMPFSVWSIGVAMGAVFLLGLAFNIKNQSASWRTKIKNTNEKSKRQEHEIPAFAGMTLQKVGVLILEEVFFFVALLFWSWIKAHEPSIRGLEKFMDFGFMQSILNSQYFPPADIWYAGLPINYYYFGHMVVAVLTRLSGLDLAYTFNLMLATIFALTLTMSFSIGVQLGRIGGMRGMRGIGGGILTAFLVTLAGNMQTIYAFTRGYTGENVKPFWELLWETPLRQASLPAWQGFAWQVGELWGKFGEGMNTYWYANATRFIPYTIHEFPGYSFVVSDVHGHVLSIPFVLLAIGILIVLFDSYWQRKMNQESGIRNQGWIRIGFYGFLVGVLLMTNALDGPIYFGLFVLLALIHDSKFMIQGKRDWRQIALLVGGVLLIAGITSLPFLVHFKSFVTGVAVNCPPAFLSNMKFGPIMFEGVEKCQVSPLWMWWLLWGFFVYCGVGLIISKIKNQKLNMFKTLSIEVTQKERLLLIFFVFALALVVFPEFFYFKDIYPAHFRSNTMFKLGYEAYILFSIVAGYTIVQVIFRRDDERQGDIKNQKSPPKADQPLAEKIKNTDKKSKIGKTLFIIFLLPQLFLVSIFPIFSVRSYFNSLKKYEGIYGLNWLAREYPDDWAGIRWLNQESGIRNQEGNGKDPVLPNSRFMIHDSAPLALVEADGDSYTDYARFSAFTGIPTIIGWPVHEWLWRGSYDVVAPRREEVRQVYESTDGAVTREILARYRVRYIIVGTLERQKYRDLQEWKFGQLGEVVFQSGKTVIYRVP